MYMSIHTYIYIYINGLGASETIVDGGHVRMIKRVVLILIDLVLLIIWLTIIVAIRTLILYSRRVRDNHCRGTTHVCSDVGQTINMGRGCSDVALSWMHLRQKQKEHKQLQNNTTRKKLRKEKQLCLGCIQGKRVRATAPRNVFASCPCIMVWYRIVYYI